ncbi:ATP-binding protein [Lacipirellula parvula]|uniref:histidine kinase n=1 Tax=Lacipirellula parvula TaxID=2650471 RepID=A0A5K7XHH6_9BACT|nr:ATP-binding protein [Lacipirellula parvula]BBO32409.1 sensor protein atoS [Lacipirellula parvula]
MASLFVIQGRDQGSRFQLEEAVHTIGRTHTHSIRLHDTEVSRNHAELIRKGNSYAVRDLGSSNGTFVNGKIVSEHELTSGDQVQVGRSLLLYTGFIDDRVEDAAGQVDIVPMSNSIDDGSRIVASLGQTGGSEWLMPDARGSSNPWLARARSNLQIMYRTALAVSHTMDIDQLLARIMDMIFDWVEADRGCIMLKDLETGKLTPKVRRHRRGMRTEEKISISKTILDYVVEQNEGVLTSNARDDSRWDPAQSIVSLGVREAICVPMQGRYEVVGVIYIDTAVSPQKMLAAKGTNQFTEEHLRLMIAIAHQAALAVEDTSYYKALVQAERLAAVGQTIASLSHHIKNILQGVRGGSYLIELGLGDHDSMAKSGERDEAAEQKAVDTIRKGWAIVERNQERISTLVMDMLTFSKEREPEPRPANLNEITSEVVELMASRAQELSVELAWQPASDMPSLMFDPEALHRAILNVVTNAIDACDEAEHPKVIVATHYDDDAKVAQITVEDNGGGIAPDDLEAIFTVFVSRKGGRGTGLGLPVTRKILEEHGGQVRVDSTVGQGSKFTLELPATPAEGEGNQRMTQSFAIGDAPYSDSE